MKVLQAQKALNQVLSAQVAITAKLAAFQGGTMPGRTKLTPREEAKVAQEQADYSFQNAVKEATLKSEILGIEMDIMEIKIRHLAEEKGWVKKRINKEAHYSNKMFLLNFSGSFYFKIIFII